MSDTEVLDEVDDFAQKLLDRVKLRKTAIKESSVPVQRAKFEVVASPVPLSEVQPSNILDSEEPCRDEEFKQDEKLPCVQESGNKAERRSRLKSLARRINEWEDDMTHYVPPTSRFNVSPPKNSPRQRPSSTPLALSVALSVALGTAKGSPTGKVDSCVTPTSPKRVRFDLAQDSPRSMSPSPQKSSGMPKSSSTSPHEAPDADSALLTLLEKAACAEQFLSSSPPKNRQPSPIKLGMLQVQAATTPAATAALGKLSEAAKSKGVTHKFAELKPASKSVAPKAVAPRKCSLEPKGPTIELNTTLAGSSSLSVAQRAKLFEQRANGNVPKPPITVNRVFAAPKSALSVQAGALTANKPVKRRISVTIPQGKVENSRRLFELGLKEAVEENEEYSGMEVEEDSAGKPVMSPTTTSLQVEEVDDSVTDSPPPSFIAPAPPPQVDAEEAETGSEAPASTTTSISFSALDSHDNTVTVVEDQELEPYRASPRQSRRSKSRSRSRSKSPQKILAQSTTPKRSASPDKKYPGGAGVVKKIKVNDPKPGHMYPSLTDIEATTTEAETEPETDLDTEAESVSTFCADISPGSSIGAQIERMAKANVMTEKDELPPPKPDRLEKIITRTPRRANFRPTEEFSPSATIVCREIDAMIDSALDGQSFSMDTIMEKRLLSFRSIAGSTSASASATQTQSQQEGDELKHTLEEFETPEGSYKQLSAFSSVLVPQFCLDADFDTPDKDASPLESSSPLYPRQREHRGCRSPPSTPLMHSVSIFRKREEQMCLTPKRQPAVALEESEMSTSTEPELELVTADKSVRVERVNDVIKKLDEELETQVRSIAQVSKALNLCKSSIEFSDSTEKVECEKVLLVASQKRNVILNEMSRLRTEGALHQKDFTASKKDLGPSCQGNMTLSGITVELKDEFIRTRVLSGETVYHFLILIKERHVVEVSSLVSIGNGRNNTKVLDANNCLHFPNTFELIKLDPDFKVELEVFVLQTQREFLPHEAKYHIKKQKESKLMTPKKKVESKFSRAVQHSPAGPDAVRSPNFVICGRLTLNIASLGKNRHGRSWNLDGVRLDAPVEGSITMKLECSAEGGEEKTGFLTLFDDISGLGAWHRRWAKLNANYLSFWMYPEDEEGGKFPIDQISLRHCVTTRVCPVQSDICARANTLLVVTTREAFPADKNSLIASCHGNRTAIRHLLSADMREERDAWCAHLNRALANLRAWDPQAASPNDTFF